MMNLSNIQESIVDWSQWDRLIQASWQGGLLLLFAWGAVLLLKNVNASVRCWIWRIAFCKFLLVLIFSGGIALPVLAPIESGISPTAVHTANSFSVHAAPSPAVYVGTPSPSSDQGLSGSWWLAVKTVLCVGWMAGVVVMTVVTIYQFRAAKNLARRSTRICDPHVLALYRNACQRMGIDSPPRLMVSSKVQSPVLVGAVRSKILLPRPGLNSLESTDLFLVLAHELAHAKRNDLVWNWFFAAVRVLFFFHPLVWLVRHRLSLDQEMACDQLALSATQASLGSYSKILVKFSASHPTHPSNSLATVGAASSFATLKARILEMKKFNDRSSSGSRWIAGCVLAGIGLLALPVSLVAQDGKTSEQRSKEVTGKAQQQTAGVETNQSSHSTATASGTGNVASGQVSTGTSSKSGSSRSVSASLSQNGLTQSLSATWNRDGTVSIEYQTSQNNKVQTNKYVLDKIEDLKKQNKQAYQFFKDHIEVAEDGSSASAIRVDRILQGSANGSQNKLGNQNNFGRSWRTDRGQTTGPRSGGWAGGGASASASASSSSSGRASSSSSNGQNQSQQWSKSTSSRSSASSGSREMLVRQMENLLQQTNDPQARRMLRDSIDRIRNGK